MSRVLDHDRLFRSEPGMLEQISERLVSLKRDYDMEVYLVYLVYLVVRSCGRPRLEREFGKLGVNITGIGWARKMTG